MKNKENAQKIMRDAVIEHITRRSPQIAMGIYKKNYKHF